MTSDRDPGPALADGVYDAMVVDVGEGPPGEYLRLELVITAGPSKGELVNLLFRARSSEAEPLDLLGLPGRITVEGGQPRFLVED